MKTVLSEVVDNYIEKNSYRAKNLLLSVGKSQLESDIRGAAFLITVLDFYFKKEHSFEDLKKIYTDREDDNQIDSIIVVNEHVYVFDIKTSGFIQSEIIDFLQSAENLVLQGNNLDFLTNLVLKKQLKKVSKIKQHNIHFIIARNNVHTMTEKVRKEIANLKNRFPALKSISLLPIGDLIGERVRKNQETDPMVISIKREQMLCEKDFKDRLSEVMIKLPVSTMLYFMEKNKHFDIFHTNVRKPQLEKVFSESLNKSIATESDHFHKLHNGITLVAEDIFYQIGKLYIKHPQVVNGAQKLGILRGKKDLKNIFLFTKIIKVDKDLSEKVCEAANTQKKVDTWDLRTNDVLPSLLEDFFNLRKDPFVYFIRKKDSTKKVRNLDRITFQEYYQWIYSCYFSPSIAKDKKTKLFSKQSDGLYDNLEKKISCLQPEVLETIAKIGVYIRKKTLSQKTKEDKGLFRDANLHLISAIHFIIINKRKGWNDIDVYLGKVFNFIKNYVNEQRTLDPAISNNKIFTKSEDVWNFIKSNIINI